jgi:hypothetical protein
MKSRNYRKIWLLMVPISLISKKLTDCLAKDKCGIPEINLK